MGVESEGIVGSGVSESQGLRELVGLFGQRVDGVLAQRSGLSFAEEKMSCCKDQHRFEEVWDACLNPGLVVQNDRNKERKGDEVANDCDRQIGDGALVKASEWNGADGEEKNIGKQEGDADGYEQLSCDDAVSLETGG